MNRKSKIIVSVVGITIVLLALLGITYAYYLTRIQGNTNTNSISITTADLKLSYDDGNEIITASNIVPNTTIAEKTFTVTNTGNSTIENYRVVLELASIEGIVPSVFKYPNDFEITLTCVSKNNTTNAVSGTCNGFTGKWNNESFEMQKNTIAEGVRHEYSLTIKYVDSGIDQSDDMGKNLNLKVQIYGELDTSTLNGTITGVDSTYAMKLNSKPKISVLKPTSNIGEYRYSFVGVEPGTHTLTLINKDGNVVSSETITINKGTETNVNGSTITVKENQSTIYLITSSSGNTLSSTATFNPYSNNTNSLAYHIINNSMNNKNGTVYRDNPMSDPGYPLNLIYDKGTLSDGISTYTFGYDELTLSLTNCVYGTGFEFDEKSGTYNLTGVKRCLYNECKEEMFDKKVYLPNVTDACIDTSSNSLENIQTNGLKNLYQVQTVDKYFVTYKTLSVPQLNDLKSENILATTNDDYGTTYYYRGDVKDNYVTFANMCWRIVRIQGDGTTKLVLEDQDNTCQEMSAMISTLENYNKDKGNFDISKKIYGYKNDDKGRQLIDYLGYTGGMADEFLSYQSVLAKKIDSTIGESPILEQVKNTLSSKLEVADWCNTEGIKYDTDYQTILTQEQVNDKLSNQENFYYDSYVRLEGRNPKEPTLKCNGVKMNKFRDNTDMYVGTLTADEIVYAGSDFSSSKQHYYLNNDYTVFGDSNNNFIYWVTFSPNYFHVGGNEIYNLAHGYLTYFPVDIVSSLRPSVLLKANTIITRGDGTQSNPYVIE